MTSATAIGEPRSGSTVATWEAARLAALDSYAILDTPAEAGFDDIVDVTRHICRTPVALVSLVAADRQWFKARVGFPPCETDLNSSVCVHALTEPDLLVIPDLTLDPRTWANPLVTGDPFIRFYAGAPLRTVDGQVLGTLCAIDKRPRPEGLTKEQASALRALARQVVAQMELRRGLAEQRRMFEQREVLLGIQAKVSATRGDLNLTLTALADGAMRAFPQADGAVVELRDADELVYRFARGTLADHVGLRLPLQGSLAGACLLSGEAILCPDALTDPRVKRDLVEVLSLRSCVVAPVLRGGGVVGVLQVQSSRPHAFTDADLTFARVFSGSVSTALAEAGELDARHDADETERRRRAVFDSAIDYAIIVLDLAGNVTDWNEGATRILGWTLDEVGGKPADVFFTPEDRQAGIPKKEMHSALTVGRGIDERWHLRKNGERFWANGEMMALRDVDTDSAVVGYVKILRDRTHERRRQERLGLLSRTSAALLSATDPGAVLRPILETGSDTLGFDRSFTYEVTPDGGYLTLTHSVGVDEDTRAALQRAPLDVPICGIVAKTGEPLVLTQIQAGNDPRHGIAKDGGLDAYAGFPVISRGQVCGVISFGTTQAPSFDEEALAFFATVARFLSIVRNRLDVEANLRVSEERWRGLFEDMQEGFFIGELIRDDAGRPVDYRFLTVNPAFAIQTGFPEGSAAGRTVREVIPDIPQWLIDTYAGVVADGAPATFEIEVPQLARWFEVHARPEADQRFAVLFLNVTARKALEARQAALLRLGDRLRELDDLGDIAHAAAEIAGETLGLVRAGYGSVDPDRETIEVEQDWHLPGLSSVGGQHHFRSYGSYVEALKRGEIVVVSDASQDPRTIADSASLEALGAQALVNIPVMERGRFVGLFFMLAGSPRSWSIEDVAFLRNLADRARAAIARVEAEAQQRLLNHELSHRMKNLLAMVQSIATQTMRNAPDMVTAKDVLAGRLVALGKAHDLLMGGAVASTRMEPVVRGALDVHRDGKDRFRIVGPDIDIGPDRALSLALMLHELATNASKYGALTTEAGYVDVRWDIVRGDTEPLLRLFWTEVGGPPVVEPTRKGFGTRFIERGLVAQVGGELTLTYPATGVECSVVAPLAAFRAAPAVSA